MVLHPGTNARRINTGEHRVVEAGAVNCFTIR